MVVRLTTYLLAVVAAADAGEACRVVEAPPGVGADRGRGRSHEADDTQLRQLQLRQLELQRLRVGGARLGPGRGAGAQETQTVSAASTRPT